MDVVSLAITLLVGVLLGALLTLLWVRRAGEPEVVRAITARGEDQAVIRDGLERLHERLAEVEGHGRSWQAQLHQQVSEVRSSTEDLRRETGALSTALRRPHVRGQWGEMHLRRAVELAGMVDHCDFVEQEQQRHPDGVRRPDLVVRLAGGKSVVVDAKVPLDAHLDALSADDADEVAAHQRRHVRQLRTHVETLAGKTYWRGRAGSPDFTVMFVPTESCLAAALETDPGLLAWAAERDVVIATPTTLIALLRTVAHGWTTSELAQSTREIHELGRELHTRLGVMGAHFDKLGRSLKSSVEAYNAAVGSMESRVLVTARGFEDIGVARTSLASPNPISDPPRALTAPELLHSVAEQRDELPSDAPPATLRREDTA